MKVLDVSEVTLYLRALLEEDPILSDLWVRGEVTNFVRSAAGHMYFTLTGDGGQLACVLFRGNQRGLFAVPRNGESVLAHGHLSIYESRGQVQLVVDNVAPEGMGILQLQFEEIKRRLDQEGLFATERKRPLPEMPAAIGVVTSAQGAVWHDIRTVVARRFPLTELILAPSAVQGPDAPRELIAGLRALQDDGRCDVIIVARGGGSAEDLACFNDEGLARAIFAARVPVVSAVGHETDVTIADLVADVRAPTPSAAAELCVPNRAELSATIGAGLREARACIVQRLLERRDELAGAVRDVLRHSPQGQIDRARQDVDRLLARAEDHVVARISTARHATDDLMMKATLLDPRDVLRRGYAVITVPNGICETRVASADVARQHARLRVTFSDGSVTTRTEGAPR